MSQLCAKFVVGNQKQRDDGSPDLCHHSILTGAGAKEAVYLQVLLDPLEKELHLPPLSVDAGNGPR
jgi:hypothetical protein